MTNNIWHGPHIIPNDNSPMYIIPDMPTRKDYYAGIALAAMIREGCSPKEEIIQKDCEMAKRYADKMIEVMKEDYNDKT